MSRRDLRAKFAMRCVSVTACLVFFSLAAFGQGDRGSITGTISDPQGLASANASIDVKNVDTGEVFHGGTSGTGNYVISVPTGRYELTVTAPGFKKYVRTNLEVAVAEATRQDVALQIGGVAETVTVTEEAPLMKTESGEVSHSLTTDDINQLPVLTTNGSGGSTGTGNIRNPLQEIILLPGTFFQNDTAIVINGAPANSENIRIEGQDSVSNIWKIAQQNSQGGVDAIQEVSVQTSNFNAEYGNAAGGYFNYTMKSGGNQFHGSGYDYFVNEFLDAGEPFTTRCVQNGNDCGAPDTQQHIRNRIRRNDYGFTLGGPIDIPKVYNGKNKSFFFFNFEQFRQGNDNGTTTTSVPTAAYRSGNFATAECISYIGGAVGGTGGTCVPWPAPVPVAAGSSATDPAGQQLVYGQIFDPYSTHMVNGQVVRTPFPNNTIPLTEQDKVALAIQNLFPQANAPGIINNYNVPSYSSFMHTTNLSVKLDHSISPTIKISGYYSQLKTYSPNVDGGILPLALGGATTDTWNHTTRLNYDQTITPTLLFHLGVGYFETSEPHVAPPFSQSSIGLSGYQASNIMPDIGGIYSFTGGGWGPGFGGVGATFSATAYEEKPTANTSLTWVHGNHTFKYGADYVQEGYPVPSDWRANGNFTFSNAETSDPWQSTQTLDFANPTGFAYASFLTGLPDVLNLNAPTDSKLGYHEIGLFAQDSWKVNRRLTLDYGLRYDYQTYMKEQYGRMQDASFGTFDPVLGRNGAVLYGASCGCQFSHNYPDAFGPRLGGAFQINSKTVLRGGIGVQYDVEEAPNGVLYSAADYYEIFPNGYGLSPMQNSPTPTSNGLQGGNPYAVGNPYGNQPVVWPNLNEDKYPFANAGIRSPGSPFVFFDPENRPGRILTYSIGIQRELLKTLVMEASYVGNRGAWFPAPNMDQIAMNGMTPQFLQSQYGININNPSDAALLLDPVSSSAVQQRFPQFKMVPINGTLTVPSVYAGFPASQDLEQALRPVPQWNGISPWLGPSLGKDWYDSLQVKMTKRFSHGLQAAGNFTWAHGMVNGAASDSTYYLASQAVTGDIYNYADNRQLNQYVRPLVTTITFTYTTPKIPSDQKGMKVLSAVVHDWSLGGVATYQSGGLLGIPGSLNNICPELGRSAGGFTSSFCNNFQNYVPGQRLFNDNPNCGCFNPQTTQVLNPNAWSDNAPGQWGSTAPYLNNFRWQRQPVENASFARNFRIKERYNFQFRAEFFNVFNRLFLSAPSTANPLTPISTANYAGNVYNSSGFGSVGTLNGAGDSPRSGQLIGRFTF
jgi:hypothetical protein